MRILLRIVFALLSVAVLVWAFLPEPDPEKELLELEPRVKEEAVAEPEAPKGPGIVTEMLGGNQIRAGKKAKETIEAVDAQRMEDLRALEE